MFFRRSDNSALTKLPSPWVLIPSGTYDGDDGRWSTFNINIAGDGAGKGQNFKALISTSSQITLVPGETGWCNTDSCAKSRGLMLGPDGRQPRGMDGDLPTWNSQGLFSLPFNSSYGWSNDLLLPGSNDTLKGAWGLTTVGLGSASKDSMTLENQYVAMQYSKDFFLSSLGIAVGSVSAGRAVEPSFFSSFATSPGLPSQSYGYTAGASYRNGGRGVTANMVLGGYDKNRLGRMTSIPMASQQDNTLLVGVQSITYKAKQDVQEGAATLTSRGFYAAIDSTFPYLVLPSYICDQFVRRFNLGYDKTTGLYTINGTAHEQNLQQNATVSFKIGADSGNTAESSTIVLGYDAFYLQASYPIYPNTTNYFPIRTSSNGYYILGRTFLQEAYVVVDYERANFSVAPAVFSDPMPIQSLFTIVSPSLVKPTTAPKPGDKGLATGAIAGIVIGIVALFALFGTGTFFYYRRRQKAKAKTLGQEEKPPGVDTAEAGGEIRHRRVSELTGSEPPYSPLNKPRDYYVSDHKSIAELSPESHPVELCSPPGDGIQDSYFAGASKPRRRGATRSSTGPNTPGTPIAELPGDEGKYQSAGNQFDAVSTMMRPKHSRGPSDNSLTTNIDEVLAGPDNDVPNVQRKHSSKFVEHTSEEDGLSRAEMVVSPLENTRRDERETVAEPAIERRPSHTRGLSDATVASDSTAVSQPTSDELESWARSVGDRPKERMSE